MKKEILEIIEWEPKRGKNGEYVRFKTNEGWMSCFDKVPIDSLKEFEGKTACVEVEEKPGKNFKGEDTIFRNITKCYGEAEGQTINVVEDTVEVVKPGETRKSVKGTAYEKDPTGLAVDVFCGFLSYKKEGMITDVDLMQLSITLVKQAKAAFE